MLTASAQANTSRLRSISGNLYGHSKLQLRQSLAAHEVPVSGKAEKRETKAETKARKNNEETSSDFSFWGQGQLLNAHLCSGQQNDLAALCDNQSDIRGVYRL